MANGEGPPESSGVYRQDGVAHSSDFAHPLQHGIIRYIGGPNVSQSSLPVKDDRRYVYVPAGYLQHQPKFMAKILDAIDLQVPNLVIVTGATEGTIDEQTANWKVENAATHPAAKNWSEAHCSEVLHSKVSELLTSTVESSVEVGAWIMPQVPRRHNGAAQMICEAIPKHGNPVAVGLIGLDEQDEEEGLKETLTSSMEPVGSPIRSVCKIEIDPYLKDAAPCPQLTHLIIFESPHELKIWRTTLLQSVPDMLLVFGKITDQATDTIFDTIRESSPVLVIKHTDSRVDKIAKMFKHVKKCISENNAQTETLPVQDAVQARDRTDALTNTASLKSVEGRLKIPTMTDMDDEQINIFISVWPATFNPGSVVVADPLKLTGQMFQKRILGAVTASFDLKVGGDENKKAKQQALDYAWSFHDVVVRHTGIKKGVAENLHFQLILFTLASIAVSVAYDQVYHASKTQDSAAQLIVFVSTIILPLYVTSLKEERDKNRPVLKWSAFKVAAFQIQSEIIKFRCQVGQYRSQDKSESEMFRPIEHFSEETRKIWLSVKKYLHDDGLDIPDSFWNPGSPVAKKATEVSIQENVPHRQNKGTTALNHVSKMFLGASGRLSNQMAGAVGGFFADETTPMLDPLAAATTEVEDDDDDDDDIEANTNYTDDHYSPMTADNYLETRVKVKMQEKIEEIEKMVARDERTSFLIKLITVFSGATAALSLQWLVPVILGVSAALTTGQEFRKYPQRIESGNTMVVRLNDMKLWWMSLSMYQRRLPASKGRLVSECENALLTEMMASYSGGAGN